MSHSVGMIVELRALGYVLNLTRFSLTMLFAASALLFFDQGQDLLIKTDEDGNYTRLLLSTLAWAFSIWLWARFLLDIELPDAPVSTEKLVKYRKHLPRTLAAIAFVSMALNLWRANASGFMILATVVVGSIF